jgi:cytosine/adenosine deaminase-related metal-dependent hydrolase
MASAKMASSKLLTNAVLLTYNFTTSSVDTFKGHLLITGDTISQVSADLSSMQIPPNTETIDFTGRIISPGFIDTHRHVWQTIWRSLGADTFLAEYFLVNSPVGHAKDGLSANDVYVSTLAGYIDGLNSGVTTIVDHCHCNWRKEVIGPALRGAIDGGARSFWSFDNADLTMSSEFTEKDRISEFKAVSSLVPADNALVKLGLVLDLLATATPQQVDNIKSLLANEELGISCMTAHLLGDPWPALCNNTPSLADSHGLLDLEQPFIFAHAPFISPADVELLRSKNHFLSITTESEMHHGHGEIASRYVNDRTSLGVDTAWTFSGDLLTQARIWLQVNRLQRYEKTLAKGEVPNKNPMTVEAAFLLATRHGGLALRRDDLGVISEGAKADLVVFSTESPNMAGSTDALAAVIMHANVGDIESVLVGGEFRKRDFKMVGEFGQIGSWADVKEQFKAAAEKIQKQVAAAGNPSIPENFFGSRTGDVEMVTLAPN